MRMCLYQFWRVEVSWARCTGGRCVRFDFLRLGPMLAEIDWAVCRLTCCMRTGVELGSTYLFWSHTFDLLLSLKPSSLLDQLLAADYQSADLESRAGYSDTQMAFSFRATIENLSLQLPFSVHLLTAVSKESGWVILASNLRMAISLLVTMLAWLNRMTACFSVRSCRLDLS